jgi:hypothetical protein
VQSSVLCKEVFSLPTKDRLEIVIHTRYRMLPPYMAYGCSLYSKVHCRLECTRSIWGTACVCGGGGGGGILRDCSCVKVQV